MSGSAALVDEPEDFERQAADLKLVILNQAAIIKASEDERKRASKRITRLARLALTLARQKAALADDLATARAKMIELEDRIEELGEENGDLEDEVNDLRNDNESLESAAGRLRDGLPDLVKARDTLKAGKADDGRHELERFLDGLDIDWTTGGCNVGALL
jgi:chromosome segregation ATPase